MKVKEESEKVGLKLNIQKTKIMASGPIRSDQIRSVAQSCLTLCDPMNRSMPSLPVHHQLPEFTETHIHRVSDAILHLILCCPLLLLPPIPPSIRVFSNQSILKEISPGISLEGMMLKLKLQYFGHLMGRVDSLEKTLMLGGIGGKRRRGQQRMKLLVASLTRWT